MDRMSPSAVASPDLRAFQFVVSTAPGPLRALARKSSCTSGQSLASFRTHVSFRPARAGGACGRHVPLTSTWKSRAGHQQGAGVRAVSTEAGSKAAVDVTEVEAELLEAITGVKGRGLSASDATRQVINRAVEALERDGGVPNPAESPLIEGRWQLMFTTRPGTASPIQRTFVGVDAFQVFQEVVLRNTEDPRISNIVVFGEEVGLLKVEAIASVANEKRVAFRFDRAAFELKAVPFKVPYPVPFRLLGDKAKGWLDTTYLSAGGDIRLSRGNKGTIFVLQKNPPPRQRLLAAITSGRGVEKAINELAPLSEVAAPAQSEKLPGIWRLLWSSQASQANQLQRLTAGVGTNYQVIRDGTLENVVDFGLGVKLRASARCSVASPVRTDVSIDRVVVELGALKLPLTLSGGGYVEQLYLDDTLRVSRGNKGSLFVHVRETSLQSV